MDNELRQLLAGIFGVRPEGISEQDTGETLGNWDSVRHLELVMALEQHYGFRIETDEIPNITSVADIVRTVAKSRG